jgi:hypothetical protein
MHFSNAAVMNSALASQAGAHSFAHARDAERQMAAFAQDLARVFVDNEAKFSGYDAVLAMTRQAFAPGSDLAFQRHGEPHYQLLTPDCVEISGSSPRHHPWRQSRWV